MDDSKQGLLGSGQSKERDDDQQECRNAEEPTE